MLGIITTSSLCEAAIVDMHNKDRIWTPIDFHNHLSDYHKLKACEDGFSERIWDSMKNYIDKAEFTGHQALIGETTVLVLNMCARIRIQLQRDINGEIHYVSFQGDESLRHNEKTRYGGDGGCGLNNIFATADEALSMIDDVMTNWDITKFQVNKKVSII